MGAKELDVVPYLYESSCHVPIIELAAFFSGTDPGLRNARTANEATNSKVAVTRITPDFFIDICFGLFKWFLLKMFLSILHSKHTTNILVAQIFY